MKKILLTTGITFLLALPVSLCLAQNDSGQKHKVSTGQSAINVDWNTLAKYATKISYAAYPSSGSNNSCDTLTVTPSSSGSGSQTGYLPNLTNCPSGVGKITVKVKSNNSYFSTISNQTVTILNSAVGTPADNGCSALLKSDYNSESPNTAKYVVTNYTSSYCSIAIS